jgi:hypothetical protein
MYEMLTWDELKKLNGMHKKIEIGDLEGKRMLSGVDFGRLKKNSSGFAPNWMLFRLDNVSYLAREDPRDGYRSCMKYLCTLKRIPTNSFAPQAVECSLLKYGSFHWFEGRHRILVCRDAATGRTVLEVGTQDVGNYYPCYVARFNPENMAINCVV